MIYFAYGSNLDPVQWAERCPGSPLIGVARLDGYRLHFPRHSPVRRCAVASIEAVDGGMAESAVVWGALYRMSGKDFAALDAREGHFPDRAHESRYLRRTVRVLRPDRTTVEALTYVAIPSPDPGHPSRSYVKHLIDGAVHHGFPAAYVAGLKAIPTKHPTSG
ncbi:MAG: gamma-glutamylcyclotransferase [Bauldia sp.]|uniref:gamma-glutamylcyclotransferase family protein n=1 Tax=Bauldia sp. TaxID=2575872 RepID=UPI001E062F3F|nr:gamma-glutamylcyclotransferase family protein [Bauldia sp.]MCB1498097.1 gamma-glutamylcyclotransferase [Bauldia sp.]